MAAGFTISGKVIVSEGAFGQLLCLSAVASFVCVLVVLTRKLWMGTDQPQQGAYIEEPPPPSPNWIHVTAPLPEEKEDVTPRSEASEEKDTTSQCDTTEDKDATPRSDTAEDAKAPPWAHKGAPAPTSFEELLKCTPNSVLRCRDRTTCHHTRLTKLGSNAFQARVKCSDCGQILALFDKGKAPPFD